MTAQKRTQGFTLVEMLLVLVITASIIVMVLGYLQQKALQMSIDRTTLQMQQILNAGLAYYVANGQWPVSTGTGVDITLTPANNLQTNAYLPGKITIASPWGASDYYMYTDPKGQLFTVYTSITSATLGKAAGAASIIAGALPIASTTAKPGTVLAPPPIGITPTCIATDTTCWVSASINIPGQNLNNAGAVNYAGLYKQGGCVPVPVCPVDPGTGTTMTPQIMVVPVSVSGLNDPNSPSVYPISSFTAYAKANAPPDANPPDCVNTGAYNPSDSCLNANTQGYVNAKTAYWRVCLQVVTEVGDVQKTNTSTANPAVDYGNNVTLMAITRCSINNETSGSKFNVYSN